MLILLILWPFAAGLCAAALGEKRARLRDTFVRLAALAELAGALLLGMAVQRGEPAAWSAAVCGMGLHLTADGFRCLWAAVTAFAWLCSCMMAPAYLAHSSHRSRYHLFTFVTLGGVMGVFGGGFVYAFCVL